jgi:Na+:H+ antiporter, NhaA family
MASGRGISAAMIRFLIMSAEAIPPRSRGSRRFHARRAVWVREALLPLEGFIHSETVGAMTMLGAAAIALVWANSAWSSSYHVLWHVRFSVDFPLLRISKDLHHWVNDGLMAVFFFVVGLEMKAEIAEGELKRLRQAALPVIAALGGMIVPALLYHFFNPAGEPARGWGIPMATDIAFALGTMALLGDRVPHKLRTFLLALAAADDIGAIIVIAVFYTGAISIAAAATALIFLAILIAMKRVGVRSPFAYAVAGILFWAAVLDSGIHATIAGVILGLLTPTEAWFDHRAFLGEARPIFDRLERAIRDDDDSRAAMLFGEMEALTYETESPVHRREREVRPWVTFFVLPLFALSNAGVPLGAAQVHRALADPVTAGVFAGLVAGKLVGVLGFSAFVVAAGISVLPEGIGWRQMAGVATLAGIGFTVSLFITGLAFSSEQTVASAKLGILAASIAAAAAGYLVLRSGSRAPSASC